MKQYYLDREGLDALWGKIKRLFSDIPFIDTESIRIKDAFFNAGYNITSEQIRSHQNAVEHKIIAESGSIDIFYPDLNEDYSGMFEGIDYMLISPAPSRDIKNSVNKSAQAMYKDCSILVTIPSIEFGDIENMTDMFSGCSNLRSIPEMNVSNVIIAEGMFKNCKALARIPIKSFESLESGSELFKGCERLESIDIQFNQLVDASNMFDSAFINSTAELERKVTLSGTSNIVDMSGMFKDSGVQIIENLDCTSVEDATDIFKNCSELYKINGGLNGLKVSVDFKDTILLDADCWREIAGTISELQENDSADISVSAEIYNVLDEKYDLNSSGTETIKEHILAKGWTITPEE